MKRLILDLRDNPGGPLDQAIRISNRFLPKGELIAYTKGRTPNSNEEYRATEDSDYTHQPLVVLVNRSSASASEIVSGALQDHDRGLIVGETTFGKALVQSVYNIGRGSGTSAGLALTTGRYYTPSGRMIQRPWDGAFDEYLTYSLRDQTADRSHDSAELRYTDAQAQGVRRRRHRAGQVPRRPDRRVQPHALRPHALRARRPSRRSPISSSPRATRGSCAANKNQKRIARGFTVTDAMLAEYKAMLATQEVCRSTRRASPRTRRSSGR